MHHPSDIYLSVIAPAFNERECIRAFVEETTAVLGTLGRSFELICVDDGSDDGTRELLLELSAEQACLRVLSLRPHAGKSAALEAGIQASHGRVLATIDVDLQNDPRDIHQMLTVVEARSRPTCVVGRRRFREDSLLRRLSSRVANRVARWLTLEPTTDAACGLKVGPASLLRTLRLQEGLHRFMAPLVRMEGGDVVEVDVHHRSRRAGRSKYGNGLGRTLLALSDAIGVRWMLSRRRRYTATELQPATEREPGSQTALSVHSRGSGSS